MLFRSIKFVTAEFAKPYSYIAGSVLELFSMIVPIALLDELLSQWNTTQVPSATAHLNRFFQTLQIRRDLEKEFAP